MLSLISAELEVRANKMQMLTFHGHWICEEAVRGGCTTLPTIYMEMYV